jgi:UDP-glucuronate decarboxylase
MYRDDGRVVSNFIVQALRGDDITLYGDGSQTRSFCYVDDLVAALLAAMETPAEFSGPVNVGNPAELSMRQLAEHVLRLSGSRSRIVHLPLPPDDPKVRRPDIALATRVLRWQPRVPLQDGLTATIDYFRSVLAV